MACQAKGHLNRSSSEQSGRRGALRYFAAGKDGCAGGPTSAGNERSSAAKRFHSETRQIGDRYVPRPKGLPKTGGRQKGTANKRTCEIADQAAREGITPLESAVAHDADAVG